jgi:puromycin-sensitive aminopeptidase
VRFAETPLLSTYLVALAVGNLKGSRATRAGETPIRVWHVPGHEKLTHYAQREAAECLTRLERYFGVPYPYGKLDLVAVPDFEFGAMENAGAVFFRETLLLIDGRRANVADKRRVVEVMCHELAHMWYGNLVTMAWWDDLWLNEAFATWMAFEIVADFHPELSMWTDFGHARDSALGADALQHTHAIYTPVASADEATENFDLITYEKGASVIRMLERYLSPAVFRRGVRDYIKRHAEGNARAADLWAALERHAGEDVAKVVRPWIEREGFPLLRVRDTGAGELVVSQERFDARGPGARPQPGKADGPWPVPVVLRTGRSRGRHLVSKRRARLPRPGRGMLYANADEGSFYRPLHEGATYQALVKGFGKLPAAERLGLVRHQWALAHAGYTSLEDLLDLLPALAAEHDPDVLESAAEPLAEVLVQVAPAARGDADARLRAVIGQTFGPGLAAVGLRQRRGEEDAARMRRGVLLALVGTLAEEPDVVSQGAELGRRCLQQPDSVDSNLAGTLLTLAAREGDADLHDALVAASLEAATPQQQRQARLALCDFRDRVLIDRTLRLTLGSTIPTQDRSIVLARLLRNPAAREATWSFINTRWKTLQTRIPTLLASRLIAATPALQTPAHRRQVMAFFKAHPIPTAKRALLQADERFRLDAAFRKRSAPQLREWLAKH